MEVGRYHTVTLPWERSRRPCRHYTSLNCFKRFVRFITLWPPGSVSTGDGCGLIMLHRQLPRQRTTDISVHNGMEHHQ